MKFNLNEFLKAVANTLDAIEIDIFGLSTNHSKRIAYISVKLAREISMTSEEVFDLASLALMHDNGASMKILHDNLRGTVEDRVNIIESMKEHCEIGEDNLRNFPFLTNPKNIIRYHHEKYDGSGFFGLSNEEIPLMAQMIALSDTLDLSFDLGNVADKRLILDHIDRFRNVYFSPRLSDAFLTVAKCQEFWDGLSDRNIDSSLDKVVPRFDRELDYGQIRLITKTLSRIIDSKSEYTQMHSAGLSEKLEEMANFYEMDDVVTSKLLIAADLHDLGKLAISNSILDKPGKLSDEEFREVTRHAEITRYCLRNISGFTDITEWACNHHEKLDGSGYPKGMIAEDLDFNSRLMVCLDIYQALREDRPYRTAMNHDQSMDILESMVIAGQLDRSIVNDIGNVFKNT